MHPDRGSEDVPDSQVVTVQEVRIKPGRVEEFVYRFRELDVLRIAAEAANGGLVEAAMACSDDSVVVVTRWSSSDGIEAWLASQSRVRIRDELDPYYAEPPVVRRFSLRERFEASSAGARLG